MRPWYKRMHVVDLWETSVGDNHTIIKHEYSMSMNIKRTWVYLDTLRTNNTSIIVTKKSVSSMHGASLYLVNKYLLLTINFKYQVKLAWKFKRMCHIFSFDSEIVSFKENERLTKINEYVFIFFYQQWICLYQLPITGTFSM